MAAFGHGGAKVEVPAHKSALRRPTSPGPGVTLDEFEVLDGDAGRSLGKGSFGVVRRVRRKGTGDVYALKTMQKLEVIEGDLIDQVEREIQVQKNLKHENVLRLYKHFEDTDTVYLLLEFCAKGELYQLLRTRKGRRFSTEVAHHYFVQVTRGLMFLHSQNIVHRDLKPENLLITHDDVLKIADFGWCAVSSVMRTTFCGTLDYLAPEMIQGRGHNHTLDIWSIGVLLYEMVVGRPPFQSTNHVMLISKILDMQLRFPAFVPQGVRDLVKRILQKEPADRLPLEQVLRHAWVVNKENEHPFPANTSCGPGRESSPSSPLMEAAPRKPQPAAVAQQTCQPSLQVSPREDGSGGKEVAVCRSPGDSEGLPLQQAVIGATPCASLTSSRAATCTSTPALRPQPPLTPSGAGCRAVAAAQPNRVAKGLQVSQASRHNASAPQTPVQQLPFRGIRGGQVVANTGHACACVPSFPQVPIASVVGCSPQLATRRSRRESPDATAKNHQQPERRPHSSGPLQPQQPTRTVPTDGPLSSTGPEQGAGTAALNSSSLSGSTMSVTAAPPQPLQSKPQQQQQQQQPLSQRTDQIPSQQQRRPQRQQQQQQQQQQTPMSPQLQRRHLQQQPPQRLAPRVPAVAGGFSRDKQPGSPKCPSTYRSLSPVGIGSANPSTASPTGAGTTKASQLPTTSGSLALPVGSSYGPRPGAVRPIAGSAALLRRQRVSGARQVRQCALVEHHVQVAGSTCDHASGWETVPAQGMA